MKKKLLCADRYDISEFTKYRIFLQSCCFNNSRQDSSKAIDELRSQVASLQAKLQALEDKHKPKNTTSCKLNHCYSNINYCFRHPVISHCKPIYI